MKARNGKLWLISVPLILVLVILAVIFWDTLLLYAAPKLVISEGLANLYGRLEERFAGSPLKMLASCYDPEGRYTAQVQAETEGGLLGDISYDLTIQSDRKARRMTVHGTAGDLDLSLYLDGERLAVSSGELVDGAWYGIAYTSFSSDIRSIPLLQFVLPDGLVELWEASLMELQSWILREGVLPPLPELTEEELHAALKGLLLLPGKVSRDRIRLSGQWADCHRVDYAVSGAQLDSLLGVENGQVSVSFYLCGKELVQLEIDLNAGENWLSAQAVFGTNPAADAQSLALRWHEGGKTTNLEAEVTTQKTGEHYGEAWHIQCDGVQTVVDYRWQESTGNMALSVNGNAPVSLVLAARENGIYLQSDSFRSLLAQLTGEEAWPVIPNRCSMQIIRGADITAPVCKNLDQWSMEDFLTLLGGVGSLLGLKLE